MSDCKTCGGTGRTSTVVKVGLLYNFGKPTDDEDTTISGRCPSCLPDALFAEHSQQTKKEGTE